MNTFKCSACGETKAVGGDMRPGYGKDPGTGAIVCYACCGVRDRARMIETGRATLYLTQAPHGDRPVGAVGMAHPAQHKVGNWPGTLTFPVARVKRSPHNVAQYRYDFWFTCDGDTWHGVQYGDNTQIAHCRRTKAR